MTHSTGKFIRIRRHRPQAKVEQLTTQGIAEANSVIKGQMFDSRVDLKDFIYLISIERT